MAKWSFLKDQFPTLPPDVKYGEALALQMEAIREFDLAEVAEVYNDLEEELTERKQDVKELEMKIEAATRVMTDYMEAAGLESAVIAGYRWTPTPEPYPTVKDRVAFRGWCDEHMPNNLALPSSTVRSVVKAALEDGNPLPPGIEVFLKGKFSRTKQS